MNRFEVVESAAKLARGTEVGAKLFEEVAASCKSFVTPGAKADTAISATGTKADALTVGVKTEVSGTERLATKANPVARTPEKNDLVEAAVDGKTIRGDLVMGTKLEDGRVVGVVQLDESNYLASRVPRGELFEVTPQLVTDETGALFRSSNLEFLKDKFAFAREDLRLVLGKPVLTESDIVAIAKNGAAIKANVGDTEKFLSTLAEAPALKFYRNPLITPSPKPVFNREGSYTNCMLDTAAVVRSMREGRFISSRELSGMKGSMNTNIGIPFPGRFPGEIEAVQWTADSAGTIVTKTTSLERLEPGRPHVVSLFLKGADFQQRHMAFAYKFKNGESFVYDAQSGVRWHPESLSSPKLAMNIYELEPRLKFKV